jgi:hypothetical protein
VLELVETDSRDPVIKITMPVRIVCVGILFYTEHICVMSQWPCGLRRGSWPVGCWDRGFESRSRHGCLSLVFLHCVVLCR